MLQRHWTPLLNALMRPSMVIGLRQKSDHRMWLCRELKVRTISIECLEGVAHLCVAHGQFERAVQLYGAVEAVSQATELPLSIADSAEYQRAVAVLRTMLGDEAFAAVWAEGRAMAWEQAIAYALAEDMEIRAVGEP